ncbi:hypothetical protein RMA73_10850 [Xanthomonas translucens pv. translucens]|uniref:hypothetical protein n=1 Tax=Xanthomonas campestris pv. translucens TaxID=343 RepID=UPI00288B5DC0|nr:hypothetical protein [Xanthomonas translucens]WNJ29167.1 hypothetical protein RMA73_10850 [Xanthomonas translucens pv. translucens]
MRAFADLRVQQVVGVIRMLGAEYGPRATARGGWMGVMAPGSEEFWLMASSC